MARPGKAPTSARAAKATKNKVEKPASSATTLDEKTPDAKRRRQLARRDTEAQVDRAMVSIHFKHISPVTLANRIVDGRTLRETLRDISHSLSPGQRIGSSTYAALARKYADGESVIENLRPTDPTTPLDDECLKLLFAADAEIGVGKAHKALMARLESCAAMSEKMVIGVVKALLNSKVLAKAGSEHLVLALMKYFERRNWCSGCVCVFVRVLVGVGWGPFFWFHRDNRQSGKGSACMMGRPMGRLIGTTSVSQASDRSGQVGNPFMCGRLEVAAVAVQPHVQGFVE